METLFISNLDGFQWDSANRDKNWKKHKVAISEIEEVFMNSPLFFFDDVKHSEKEQRILALGQTYERRKLSITFTIRHKHIRVISARDMSKKERRSYEESIEKDSSF
jgi:uncharacterized DUF497 family protein